MVVRSHLNSVSAVVLAVLCLIIGGPVSAQNEIDVLPPSLKVVRPAEPAGIGRIVKNKSAAIMLGKALYWDMQAGSDGVQACASCHFNAGADTRAINTLNPGSPNLTGLSFEVGGPNHVLTLIDFPFHRLADPEDRLSDVLFDSDDVCGSQGVFSASFTGLIPGSWLDLGSLFIDPVFSIGGTGVRQVTGRNTPSVINAVYNHRQFWDGRATSIFNGVDPFGPDSANAYVFRAVGTAVEPFKLNMDGCSLASQAVGPPVSGAEMAHSGRDMYRLGKKLLKLRPLARQKVHPLDSVLAPLAVVTPDGRGLKIPYSELIKLAFRSEYWNSTKVVRLDESGHSIYNRPSRPLAENEYTLMEANFPMFWGLAIQLYESTLISDDAPYDRYAEGDTSALTPEQVRGLDVFMNKGQCIGCHAGSLFSSATIPGMIVDPDGDVHDPFIEKMTMADGEAAVYDIGFYNIAVRPTEEDLGIGGVFPSGAPLSISRTRFGHLRTAVDGAFKTPILRNVELTGPYFHNGGQATLEQVVQFYDRGADFLEANLSNVGLGIMELGLTEQEKSDLVAFLKSLTDERVRYQRAPFDHPELWVPDGHAVSISGLPLDDGTGRAVDRFIYIPAVGSGGGAAVKPFLQ